MNPKEAVALTRYVRALCPQQKFDEFTADAWGDVLAPYELDDCRAACVVLARKQPFISPAEIIEAIRGQREGNARDIQGPGLPAAIPDADPDDWRAYIVALRAQRTRAADGENMRPRPVAELVERYQAERTVPTEDQPGRGPLGVECPRCGVAPMRACQSSSGRRLNVFHPSRIESGRRVEAGMSPLDGDAGRREIEERKAASRRALEALQDQTPNSPKEAS